MFRSLLVLLLAIALSGCEELGIPDPAKVAAAAEAEGRAIGGACRHAGRALEDCYALNPGASKSSIFEGWRSMNDYMTENKIEIVPPTHATAAMPVPGAHAAAGMAVEEKASADETRELASADPSSPEDKPDRPRRSSTLRSLQDR